MAEVVDVPEEQRYVLTVDGQRVGRLDYAIEGDVFVASHVVVQPSHEGQGLGGVLVAHVLDHVRVSGWRLRADCPFVEHFVSLHPAYADLLEDAAAGQDGVD
jgi:uncharacterized protein